MRNDDTGNRAAAPQPFSTDDLHDLHALYGDPDVMRFITGKPRSLETTRRRLEAHMADYERYGFGLRAALSKVDGAMIGRCGLEPKESGTGQGIVGELAWLFEKRYWARGWEQSAAE